VGGCGQFTAPIQTLQEDQAEGGQEAWRIADRFHSGYQAGQGIKVTRGIKVQQALGQGFNSPVRGSQSLHYGPVVKATSINVLYRGQVFFIHRFQAFSLAGWTGETFLYGPVQLAIPQEVVGDNHLVTLRTGGFIQVEQVVTEGGFPLDRLGQALEAISQFLRGNDA